MLRDGKPVGAISLGKAEAGPFSERQTQLLTTFADQAIIAIENTRLFEEVQARTRELTELLEYQTATSDVLSVISRSPSQVVPVMVAISQTARRLCEADRAAIRLFENGKFRQVAMDGAAFPPEFETAMSETALVAGRDTPNRPGGPRRADGACARRSGGRRVDRLS